MSGPLCEDLKPLQTTLLTNVCRSIICYIKQEQLGQFPNNVVKLHISCINYIFQVDTSPTVIHPHDWIINRKVTKLSCLSHGII